MLDTSGELDTGASLPEPNDTAFSGWTCSHDFSRFDRDLPSISPSGAVTAISEREALDLGRPTCGAVAVITTGPALNIREIGLILVSGLIGAIVASAIARLRGTGT